jgi:hypothetical protein
MDQSTNDRIATLENAVMQLAQQVVDVTTTAVAQGVICRAVVEMMAKSDSSSVTEVRDFALSIADTMEPEIGDAVRVILAELPAGAGRAQ